MPAARSRISPDAGGWEADFGRDMWQMCRLGLGLPVASRGLLALTRFAVFCQRIDITALAWIDQLWGRCTPPDMRTPLTAAD